MPPPDEDLREFLAERRYATLATSDPEGGIHLTPVWFLFEDDRFLFASRAKWTRRSSAASSARRPSGGSSRSRGNYLVNVKRARCEVPSRSVSTRSRHVPAQAFALDIRYV